MIDVKGRRGPVSMHMACEARSGRCTERLKIKPSNAFIRGVAQKYGEAILVLGTHKAESQKRAATIEKHAARQARDRLVPNASLPNSLVYTPIEDWNTV